MTRDDAPYRGFAEIYDRIMRTVGYRMWADYIEELCRLYKVAPRRVLDLACGTGSTSLPFAKRGYEVIGIDRSPAMLARARRKAQSAGLDIDFREGDMRSFKLEHHVDLAICLYDSINYVLDPAELSAMCTCVCGALRPGGLFVFDANTPYRLAAVDDEPMFFDEDDLCLVWRNSYDAASMIWRAELTGFIRRGELFERFHEVHEERAYAPEELAAALREGGLEVEGMFSAFGFDPVDEHTARVYVIARRPEGGSDTEPAPQGI
jgi:SAM-dependent methyltransferase